MLNMSRYYQGAGAGTEEQSGVSQKDQILTTYITVVAAMILSKTWEENWGNNVFRR